MKKIILKIDGMYCDMCHSHINNIIRNNFKIKKVSSNHSKGISEIISEDIIEKDDLIKAFEGSGYKIIEYNIEDYKKKGLFG